MKRIGMVAVGALCVFAACAFAAEIDLAGTWRLERTDDKSVACEIAVPGGVHSALLKAGLGDHGLATLCNAIMREHTLRTYIATYRHELI